MLKKNPKNKQETKYEFVTQDSSMQSGQREHFWDLTVGQSKPVNKSR